MVPAIVRALPVLCGAVLVSGMGAQPPRAAPAGDDVPRALRDAVFGTDKQPRFELVLAGTRFRAIRTVAAHPELAWPIDAAPAALARDRAAVDAWLASVAGALGHGAFVPRWKGAADWQGSEAWDYEFVHGGLPLVDWGLRVFWDGERFAGLQNRFPGPIAAIETATAGDRASTNRVWHAQRRDGAYHIVLATLQRESNKERTITSLVTSRGVAYRLHEAHHHDVAPPSAATFTEYAVPAGTVFPDQIWADAKGLIWFSQPNNNLLTSFDPASSQLRTYPTSPGSGPDGMIVDDQDRVWTGLYFSQELGVLDVPSGVFTRHRAPYSPANPAIPTMSGTGTVWVTDHANNKISEWDPRAATWLQTLTMPTPACWVVAGVLDPTRGSLWFTEYNVHQLGHKPLGQAVVDIPVPSGGGPAFLAYNDDKVYYSLWLTNRLGEYDVVAQRFTEYTYLAGETGGPLFMAPNGKVIVGTRNRGYVVVFDPASKTFQNYAIPTASPGLKDGLTVAQDGAIWFTESGQQKIARLVLP